MNDTDTVSVDEFVQGLCDIPERRFTQEHVLSYMTHARITSDDLHRFTSWKDQSYTRNLVFKNELFEAIVLCWDIGQESPIHNHTGQLGWAMIYEGSLSITNYRLLDCDALDEEGAQPECCAADCQFKIEEVSRIAVARSGAIAKVDERATIHKIANLESFGERAVSMHIYSRPYDSCVVYDTETNRCRRIELGYDTMPS